MGFKKELKALEILEKPEAFLTRDFDINHITHSKLFYQTGSQNIIHPNKRTVFIYRLVGGPPPGDSFLGGGHMVFKGNEGRISRRQQSIKGTAVFIYHPGRVGQRIFGVIWFSGGMKVGSVVANRV